MTTRGARAAARRLLSTAIQGPSCDAVRPPRVASPLRLMRRMDERNVRGQLQDGQAARKPQKTHVSPGRREGAAPLAAQNRPRVGHDGGPPSLLTASEVAVVLRTSCKAVYAMAERAQLPGVTRIGRRLLVRRDDLLSWLDERRAASPGGIRR
jgi:excisionase family DNA binding protein